MRYEKKMTIGKQEAAQINKHLHEEPTCADECLGEDITIVNTATFDNGIEMDIKCCGVQYDENSESNTAWTEAVLFKNGNELCCTEPSEEYLGEWILEHEGDEYVVIVEEEKNIDLSTFVKSGNNKKEAYESFCEFEKGFDKEFRTILSYEKFCKELNKGYGNSEYTQIARLYEDKDGVIWYDNEYV